MTGSEAKELDYGIAMSVNTLVTAMAMREENHNCELHGFAPAFEAKDFEDLIKKNGTHHNGVLSRWEGVLS